MKTTIHTHRITSKGFWCLLLLILGFARVNAQVLTGTKTIPGSYATIALAVADLNAKGVGAGGVIFNVAAGYTETLTAPIVMTATGTAANTIVFQKSGTGANPKITAFTGSQTALTNTSIDVMWSFIGSDYVTISQIDLAEAAGNTSSLTMMETGYGFYKADAGNGTNNNTVQNCTITLNRNNIYVATAGPRILTAGAIGIEMLACTPTAIGTTISVTNVAGASSNNKFYGNTIQNCNFGISLSGFAAPAPFTFGDANNDIGGTSTTTGNTIINFGGGVGAYAPCGAILIRDQWGAKIQYNTINNNTGAGVNHIATSNRGIWLFASSAGASCDVNYNKLTIKADGVVGTSTANYMIDVEMAQTGSNGNTINVNNNQFLNCTYTAFTNSAFPAIFLLTTATNVNVNNNYVYGYTYGGQYSSGYGILNSGTAGIANLNISNNIIDSSTFTGGSGTFYGIGMLASVNNVANITNNTISRINMNTSLSGGSTFYGINVTGTNPVINVLDNTISNISRNGTTGGTTYGISSSGGAASIQTIKRNTISNFTQAGTGATGAMFGIQITTAASIVCDSNTLFNLAINKTTATGNLFVIYGNQTAATSESYSYNNIYNITNMGTGVTIGMDIVPTSAGTRTLAYNTIYNVSGNGIMSGVNQTLGVSRVFNNKIYDLTNGSTTAVLAGLQLQSFSAGTSYAYNNVVSRLFAPVSNGGATFTVVGIAINNTTAATTVGLYNNTVNLNATSTGANFSSAGISHTYNVTATTSSLDMRNNIIVNTSTPTGTGIAAAFRRSASTDLNNFNTLSNRNLFYAGTPATSNNLLYYDGTNKDSVLSTYLARVAPRDSASVTENVSFISTVGSSASFLKVNTTTPTAVESRGRNTGVFSTDYANVIRAGNPGYLGTAAAPDLGAYEANHTGLGIRPMAYDSAIAEQRLGAVAKGSLNMPIIRVRVHSHDGDAPLTATSFAVANSSTTNTDITSVKMYYTSSDSTFTNPILFGSTTAAASMTVSGTQKLVTGVNYFWVVYDVSATAVANNALDAVVNSVTVGGIAQSLAPFNDPTGNRIIKAPLSGPYTIGSGQNYGSITAAVAELAAVGVSGPVTFTLTDPLYNTATTGEVYPITISSFPGASAVNKVTMRPAAAISVRIESANTNTTIDMNGVRFFNIDGRQGGTGGFTSGQNLVITNTSTSAPAIRFINEASMNSVLYCDLKGSNTLGATANAGVVNFGTTTGLNGNDSNTIRYCDIHEETSAALPLVGVSSIGSGTTVAQNNDFNIIDSCNIYNQFSATFGFTSIYVGANNGTWRITANHFYQTATRTSTSTQQHRVLWITPNTANLTSANGFVINNNYIGGSAADGTGTMTLAGTSAYLFAAMDLSVGLGTATSVQNNTITNINMTSSSAVINTFYGINMVNGNIDCGTVTGNLIGSRTVNGAITFNLVTSTTGGGMIGIRTGGGTWNTFNIANNIIGGINLVGNATLISPEFLGMNLFTATYVNANNNMIGDTILANSINITTTSSTSTLAQRVAGIFANPALTGLQVFNITNNTIANITNNNTATGTQVATTKGIWVNPAGAGISVNVTGNVIKNITSAVQTTNASFNAALVGIGVSSTVGNISVAQNKISGLTLVGTSTTAAVQLTGISYAASTTGINEVKGNLVHGLNITAVNPNAVLTGISVESGIGNVYNNMVRLGLDTMGNTIATACAIRGINKGTGSNGIYNNSVYIGGNNVSSSANRTVAFQRTGAGVDDVRNNIFSNLRINTTTGGGHMGVILNNSTTLTASNNVYNVNGADTIGMNNGIGYLTLSTWKNNTGVDLNSALGVPGFVNATAAAVNLHLTGTTPAEASANIIAAVTTDYDGDLRSTTTPDIGADEGTFTKSDIAAPAISYTALVNDTITGTRTITATITDVTGVNRVGAIQPRVYFKKNTAGSWFSTQGTFVSGTSASGTWSFTITPSLMSGVVGGDSVYYFVAAQDSSSAINLGSFPGGIEGTNVNSITVYPISPLSYNVLLIAPATITVGATGTYTTLTGSNGAFNAINNSFIKNNVTLQIVSDIEEPGTVALNELNQGAGTYKVSIVPSAATLRNITGTTNTLGAGLITLNGADRVKIDGSFGGSGRYLRFMNRSKIGATINFVNDADIDTVANSIVEGVDTLTGYTIGSSFGIITFQGAKTGGTGNDSNVIMNCIIRDTLGTTGFAALSPQNRPDKGIYSNGTTTFSNDYNVVSNCQLFNIRTNPFVSGLTGGDFWTVNNNSFYSLDDSLATTGGICWIYFQSGIGHIIRKNSLGGKAPDRSGVAFQINNLQTNNIINLQTVGNMVPSIVDSNTVSNIAHLNNGAGGLYAIRGSGAVIIRANTVGGGQNPWDTLAGSNVFTGIIASGGSYATVEVSNNVLGNFYCRVPGNTQTVPMIFGSQGNFIIKNNILRDYYFNGTAANPPSLANQSGGPTAIQVSPAANELDTVQGNIITNMNAALGNKATGIFVSASANYNVYVGQNRISNLIANNPAVKSAAAIGIVSSNTSAGTNNYVNNEITLGANATHRVFGIVSGGSTAQTNYFSNNSILITGQGDSSSCGIFNAATAAGVVVGATNNLIYNKRINVAGSTAKQTAFSGAFAIAANLPMNYNLCLVNDTAVLFDSIGLFAKGWSTFNSMNPSTYNTNWVEKTSNVLAENLFTDTTNGNLSIIAANPEAWYVNGKGIRVTGYTGDFNNVSGVRSGSIATGAVDIGAVEFTPTSIPPSAYADKLPLVGDSTQFFFGGRMIAKANWTSGTFIPSAIDMKYYSGVTPANISTKTAMNAYWNFTQTGGSAFTYGLTLMQDSAVLGTVASPSNLGIARYSGTGVVWTNTTTAVNTTTGFMNTSGLGSVGIFTGTDLTNNPLPVKLLSLTASNKEGDVLVSWTTASEENNKGFEVERSIDGRSFEQVGFVKGAGNSNQTVSYNLTDAKAFAVTQNNVLYYRLKQLDYNEEYSYSEVVAVRNDVVTENGISAYPNPFADNYTVSFTTQAEGRAAIQMMDIQGKLVAEQTTAVGKGTNVIGMDKVSGLERGIYFVKVSVNGESHVLKMIKQ